MFVVVIGINCMCCYIADIKWDMGSEGWCNLLRPPPIPFSVNDSLYTRLFNIAAEDAGYLAYASKLSSILV